MILYNHVTRTSSFFDWMAATALSLSLATTASTSFILILSSMATFSSPIDAYYQEGASQWVSERDIERMREIHRERGREREGERERGRESEREREN